MSSPISETAGRRALKTKFSPPPGGLAPRVIALKKEYCLGFDPVLGLALSWVWPVLGLALSWV